MRSEPPTGEEFERLLDGVTQNVLRTVAYEAAPADAPRAGARAGAQPRHRYRLAALVVAAFVVLGVGTAGGALALGFGPSLWGGAPPATTTPSATASPAPPQPTSTPTTTAPAPPPPPVAEGPAVSTPNAGFTAPSWGDGLTAELTGFEPDTEYTVSTASRYRGESGNTDGFFSIFSTPYSVTTDASGSASVTWTPDTFPENFTDSGESGWMLGSYLRVDLAGDLVPDDPEHNRGEPLALSDPLPISFLPIDEVTVSAAACIEPEQLVAGQEGLTVTVSGLEPNEFVATASFITGDAFSYSFDGRGRADDTGTAVFSVHGNSAEYPVSTSAEIAPSEFRLLWSANYRAQPPDGEPDASIPLTVGGCGG